MMAASGLARTYPQLFLTRVGVGVGEAGCHPPAHSLIGSYFPREKRALGISIFNLGAAVGFAGGVALIGVLGEHLGWRAALQIVGLMGIPLALLTFFTLKEPPRPPLHKENRESPFQSIGGLLRRRSYVHLVVAYSLGMVGSNGFSTWAPAFLMRSYGMGVGEVGVWIGGITGAFAALGTLSGGVIATGLMRRDLRWELWLPALSIALCIPLFLMMILSHSVWWVLVLKAVNTLFGAIGTGVALAALQSFAEPHRRATAVAIALFLQALLGTGVGPFLIGLASTALEPTFGQESLRYALLVTPVMLVWSITHYALAARNSIRDRVN
jgi:predicted MFS family arabinose efflux permease